ncbi:acyltransferase family protein [Apibacter sp. HY039]|uniref:acyltransferase family protein n=1 Tax=Apibacter sp. HY039 TaxID=2501476 RepID=UPI000FEC08BA|nr:acyltransferase family protein [Apibacter sp. HY039]
MKRNLTLDYYKIILSILIIYLHFIIPIIYDNQHYSEYMSKISYFFIWQLSGIAKLGVPAFFIINGYYLSISDDKKTFKYIFRIFKLYIVWTLFYLPWMPWNDEPNKLLLILNLIFGFYHLWYLSSLIGAILILYLICKCTKNVYIIVTIISILFITGYLIQLKFGAGNLVLVYIFRNSLFFALPYVTLGFLIRKINIKNYKIIYLLIILCLILLIIETYYYTTLVQYYDIYLSAFILCPLIFILLLNKGKIKTVDKEYKLNDLSSAIYYIHPAILLLTNRLISIDNQNLIYWLPFLVITIIFFSFTITGVNKIFKFFL